MNFIIPMAGRGSRFRNAGFVLPKFLIPVCGRTLLEWSLLSLPLDLADRVTFVGLAEDNNEGELEKRIRDSFPLSTAQISFCWLKQVTNGQATTVLRGLEGLDEGKPLLIYNIDTTFLDFGLSARLQDDEWYGLLGSFSSQAPNLSYAALDDSGRVCRVEEKNVISEHALNGLYVFRSGTLFREAYEALSIQILETKGEIFVAPLYEHLLQQGMEIELSASDETHPLGTPEELRLFKEHGSSYREKFSAHSKETF